MNKQLMGICLILITLISACEKERHEKIDTEYPQIDLTADNTFPQQCSVIKKGEPFVFRATVSDNMELGSISIDIHHNFDHHAHSTEVENCGLDPVKTPEKPFLLIQRYDIPENLKTYQVEQEVSVPADIDTGDYHFLIRLTDHEGWQTIKRLSIKIVE